MRHSWYPVLTALLLAGSVSAQDTRFSWDHATVYHMVTDRFSNGDSSNDFAYGRGLDGDGREYPEDPTGHFIGGDYEGILGWMEEGYFDELGVNVLWLSAPYEQVHGWVGGGDGDFQLYAYDGSWPLDYTSFESAFGGAESFASLANAAKARGMRIIVDVDLNHVGPATMHDMASFGFGGLTGEGWRTWQPSSRVGWQSYLSDMVTLDDSVAAWQRWWGADWIRANVVGYETCGSDPLTECANGLPDLRSDVEVDGLPSFLTLKWGAERSASESAELDAFFARTGAPRTAAHHVVKWLADWVVEQDIDGFHVREAAHIDPAVLSLFVDEVERAWKSRHATRGVEVDHPFLLLAATPAPVSIAENRNVEWRVLEEHRAKADLAVETQSLTASLEGDVRGLPFRTFPASTSDTNDRDLVEEAASFLLSPGPIVITYGAESGRMPGPDVSDARHRMLSGMNWSDFDEDRNVIWTSIGSFRGSHPAVARGGYDAVQDDPVAFHRGVRIGMDTDQVIIATGAEGRTRLNVSIVWPDDTVLKDAMTGKMAFVSFGQISVTPHPSGLVLLEEVAE